VGQSVVIENRPGGDAVVPVTNRCPTRIATFTRLTGRGKAIFARAISGRIFAGSKEDGED
jgi:hypothetical protein